MPCCMIATPDRGRLGRVGPSASVADVWSGPAYEPFRNALSSDTPPAVCQGCPVYKGTF